MMPQCQQCDITFDVTGDVARLRTLCQSGDNGWKSLDDLP